MKTLTTWVKASRLPAQTFIFPSLLFGQVIAMMQVDTFSWWNFMWIHLYGFCMHFFIVYANDYADYQTDQLNQTFTPFTGGSRVLVDGNLTQKNLLTAGIVMAFLALSVGVGFTLQQGHIGPFLLALIGLFLLYAYSFSPFKISYRGFGETLQMLGVGVILPLFGFVAQGGELSLFPTLFILMMLPSQLAMAISTSLPDEPSDRSSNKRTTVVILGADQAKTAIIFLYLLSLILFLANDAFDVRSLGVILFIIIMIILILTLSSIFIFKQATPGSKWLFLGVALSILTNTVFVLGSVFLLL